jgi:ribosomal-protein-alanine N-acetyltransferase
MQTSRLTLLPCTLAHVEALIVGPQVFEQAFGLRVIDGYLEFPEALTFTREQLQAGAPPEWWSHLFIHTADKALIGLGGYVGVPDPNGQVEIGYGIAPAYRGQGYATEAAQAMITNAFAHDSVQTVIAHTLAEQNASVQVLTKCGLRVVDTIESPEEGNIWRWAITRSEYTKQ